MLTFRELPIDEWDRLLEQGCEPYASSGLPVSDENWRILVAEEDGRIVGHTAVHTQIHWDPWQIARPDPAIVRGLIRQGRDLLRELLISHAFCTIDQSNVLTMDQAERLGFASAPGKLYLLDLDQLKEF